MYFAEKYINIIANEKNQELLVLVLFHNFYAFYVFYGYHENSLYSCLLAFVYFGRHYIFAYCFAYRYLLFTGTAGQERRIVKAYFIYLYDLQKPVICLITNLSTSFVLLYMCPCFCFVY